MVRRLSEPCFPTTEELGDLSLDEVLLEYDGPRLFSCSNRATRRNYLVLWIGEENGADAWLLAPTSTQAIKKVRNGRLEVRQPFLASESGKVYKLSIKDDTTAVVEHVPTSALTEDILPEVGERLEGPKSSFFRSVPAVAAGIMVVLSLGTIAEHYLLEEPWKGPGIRFLFDGIESVFLALLVKVTFASLTVKEVFGRLKQKR
jgi:hypothetical protein